MRIVIDDDIPFIKGVFEPYASVDYITGSKIEASHVKHADALIVRTRTKCNEQLLKGSQVKYIASATIGFDHIDTAWCAQHGITWSNAAGCNAASVAQYVLAALLQLQQKHGVNLQKSTLGIVGVGHVGRKVQKVAQALGMTVLLNDPPRQRVENTGDFVSLQHIQQHADIITFHTPLTREGEDKTYHLADTAFFSSLKPGVTVINTSRGEVIDETALKTAIVQKQVKAAVLDVWEREPQIDLELLRMVDIGTPHIAGYSTDGKANATKISVRNVAAFFGLPLTSWEVAQLPVPENTIIDARKLNDAIGILALAVSTSYNIMYDYGSLLDNPAAFESLRKNYRLRREFPVFQIETENKEAIDILFQLGFE